MRILVPLSVLLLSMLAACARVPDPAARSPIETGAGAEAAARVAAGGLVEPAGEERVIIPQLSGRLARVLIDEGDAVSAGQLLAEIENAEYRAALAAAEAQVALRRAERERLRNGARREEVDQAAAVLAAATAQQRLAAAEATRRTTIAERGLISAEQREQAEAQAVASDAERRRAAAALALLEAGARREDLDAADAALAAAEAERDRAQALLEKSLIRSPIDGTVLKRDQREGETVVALAPVPLARIGDLSHLQVRADVDELDIGRVRVGQDAHVQSDAFAGRRFAGRVTHVSRRMGPRNQTSGDPAEKQDAKILEVLIELDGQPPLPVGLRVDVFIRALPAEPAGN